MKQSINRRITVYFIIIMTVTGIVSVAWNYYSTRQSILEMERTQANGCAGAISTLLDNYGDALKKEIDSEEYTFLWRAIRNFSRGFTHDALYIYTIDPQTGDHDLLLQAVSSEESDRPSAQKMDDSLFSEPSLNEAEEMILSGESSLKRAFWRRDSGAKIMWIAPYPRLDSGKPAFICMEYNLDLEKGHILRDFLADILLPIIALDVAFLVLILMIRKRVTVPIRRISDRMKRFAHNSSERPEPLNIPYEDEIGEIASSFERMTEDISAYIGNIETLTQERVETNVQLDIARRIQYGFVPEKKSMRDTAFCINAMTRPAKAVGGDFYDFFRRNDGTVCIVMGDVSGKGITAAIFMAMLSTVIREKLTAGFSPAQALNDANRELIAQNPEGFFATVFVAILNPGTGELRYANAGHTCPVLLGGHAVVLEPDSGTALGLFEDAEILDGIMTLPAGWGMILYTDGVTDALNAEHSAFGMERLLDVLAEDPHAQDPAEDAHAQDPAEDAYTQVPAEDSYAQDPAEEVVLRVSRAVNDYCGDVEPFDDMAILVLFMTGAQSEESMFPVPVSLSSFETIRQTVFDQAGDTPKTRNLLLACDEALSNIVRYSGATSLAFGCSRQGDTLSVVFADNGIPFDPTAALADEKEFEELEDGGMGLNLIRQMVASVGYERRGERNLFTLTHDL